MLKQDVDKLPAGVWKVASVAMLGSLLAQIDSTVVNVSLSTLVTDLRSTLATIQWVTSGYLLALAMTMPLNGWLVDRVGARRLYLWCFTAFTLSSALCGLAWSADSLIAFRILQGITGGLLAPMAQLILAQAAGRHMAKVIGYAAVPVLIGPILGPILAGAILQSLSWRWLFLINLPVGALALMLAIIFLPADELRRARRSFDLSGFLLLAPALVLFLYGIDHIGDRVGQLCLGSGIIMMAAFIRGALRKGPDALLDLHLFRGDIFPVAAQSQFLQNGVVYAAQMLLPLYLIRACGRTPGDVGFLLLPLGLGMLVVYPSMGWLIQHLGIRNVAAAGSTLSLLSTAALIYLAQYQRIGLLFTFALLVRGAGQGAIGVPSISAAYRGVPKEELPMATTTLNIVQRLGGPTITTLMAAFLAWRMQIPLSAPQATQAFVLSFAALGALHLLLLITALRLPKSLPGSA